MTLTVSVQQFPFHAYWKHSIQVQPITLIVSIQQFPFHAYRKHSIQVQPLPLTVSIPTVPFPPESWQLLSNYQLFSIGAKVQ